MENTEKDITILETTQKGVIISLKYKDKIFKLGDLVDLNFNIERGIFQGYIIEEFQEKKKCNKHFPTSEFPKYTIITNVGCIWPGNAEHVDYNSRAYKLNNTECLSIIDIFSIFGEKKHKKLLKLVEDKLKNEQVFI